MKKIFTHPIAIVLYVILVGIGFVWFINKIQDRFDSGEGERE